MVEPGRPQMANIIQRMFFACWITKATDTHSEYEIPLVFQDDSGYANAPKCYVIRTLPVVFNINTINIGFMLSSLKG
jgi:hypothetical protein